MSEATNKSTSGGRVPPPPPDIIDLNTHPDGPLLRLCAALERLSAIADELEAVAAALPARTMLGRRMKALSL